MNFKRSLLSYSLMWTGVLFASLDAAQAETLAPVSSNSLSSMSMDLALLSPRAEGAPSANGSLGLDSVTRPERLSSTQPPSTQPPSTQSRHASMGARSAQTVAKQRRGKNFATLLSPGRKIQSVAQQSDRSSSTPSVDTPNSVDPELGILRLREVEPGAIVQPPNDPELGTLRLREAELLAQPTTPQNSGDPELGTLRLRNAQLTAQIGTSSEDAADPELGLLRLRDTQLIPNLEEQTDASGNAQLENLRRQQAARNREQTVFLTGRFEYFNSDNVFLDDIDPVDERLARIGVSLLAVPKLGPRTQLIASVGGNLFRYDDLSELNYHSLDLRVGIRQTLFPRTYGEISWRNQQFFSTERGDRFLNDHSLRLSLSRRDRLSRRLTLDSFYQLRLSFAEPSDRSRVSNAAGFSLDYDLSSDWQASLDYQFILTNFTQQERDDTYHQVTAQLTYRLSRNSRVGLFFGQSFGHSSEPGVGFDSSTAGVFFSTSIPLF